MKRCIDLARIQPVERCWKAQIALHGRHLSRRGFRWVKSISGWSSAGTDDLGYDRVITDCDPGEKVLADASSRLAAPSAPSPVEVGPASDQARVEAVANTWAELWAAHSEYSAPCLAEADAEQLPPLTAADIVLAAKSFPSATGVGARAIAPRAIARLPTPLLDELASLLMLAENTGNWSEAIALVLIVLLPKEGGGHRPIGLFPTLIRVWMRARAALARDWDKLTASPDLFGSKGMGAQRAAWTSAFAAETAAVLLW